MIRRAKKTATRGYKNQPEWDLQCAIAEYLRKRYPSVRFLSDVKAAVKLTIPQAVRLKKVQAQDFACPDLMIFAARHGKHGAFMEFKAESPYRKDGELRFNTHLCRQTQAMSVLRCEGYLADFYWDFDESRKFIDWYLNG